MDMKNWRYFLGSCILAGGLLIKAGAPLVPVVLGVALAAFLTWKRGPARRNKPGLV